MARGDLWLKLGRGRDSLGDIDAAMQAFASGHAERFAQVTSTHAALPHGDGLLAVLDVPVPVLRSALTAPVAGDPPDPVFLVGFPRSGTTLVTKNCWTPHAGLASFDEQPFLQRLVSRINERNPGYPEALSTLTGDACRALRKGYFADVARVLPQLGTRRAVDKNPLNLVRLPLVAALFPEGTGVAGAAASLRRAQLLHAELPLTGVLDHLRNTGEHGAHVCAGAGAFSRVSRSPGAAAARGALRGSGRRCDWRRQGAVRFPRPAVDDLAGFTERARRVISTPSYAQVVQPVNQRAVGRWS